MTSSLRSIPDVLHIGFSKCGSSYLRALFRSYPTIKLVWKSGFFTPEFYTPNKLRPSTLEEYQALFERQDGILNVESDEHLAMPSVHPELGVRATRLKDFEHLIKSIAAFLPSLKIIMVFRNQPSLLVSRYSEYLIAGGKLDFDAFLSILIGNGGAENNFFQNYYSEMIGILEQNFSKSQLLILAQEEMISDVTSTGAKIAEFLGLGRPIAIKSDFISERKSLSVAGLIFLRITNRCLVSRSSFAGAPPLTRCPGILYRNVVRGIRILDYFFLRRLSRTASCLLTDEKRLSILSHFRQDNLKLREVIGLQLADMGYVVESNMEH